MYSDRKIRLKEMLETLSEKYESDSHLARAMNIPRQAFGTYIRAESFPTGENLEKIAKFLNLTVDDLLVKLSSPTAIKKLKTKEKSASYQVGNKKAEDFVQITSELPDNEKIRLARFLLDLAVN